MKHYLLVYGISTGLLAAVSLTHYATPTRPTTAITQPPGPATADCEAAKGLDRIVCLADAFKAGLTAEQVAVVQRPYSKTDATKWSNFPEFSARPRRVGIRLGSLTEPQRKAANALLTAVMARDVPNEGYDELEGNLAADEYLGKLIGKTDIFNAGNYYLAFLGTPSTTGQWELQFGGHHFAVSDTYKGGKLIGATPSFRGVEPIAPVVLNGQTHQSMEQERAAFSELIGRLTKAQLDAARLSVTFRDVLLGPDRDGQFPAEKLGLPVSQLTKDQKQLVLNAISRYVNDLDPAMAAPILATYTADLDKTYIAFSGSGTMSQPGDYVRLDGPRVWIEYSGQPSRDIPGTVHPHSVWRDHLSDYGGL